MKSWSSRIFFVCCALCALHICFPWSMQLHLSLSFRLTAQRSRTGHHTTLGNSIHSWSAQDDGQAKQASCLVVGFSMPFRFLNSSKTLISSSWNFLCVVMLHGGYFKVILRLFNHFPLACMPLDQCAPPSTLLEYPPNFPALPSFSSIQTCN